MTWALVGLLFGFGFMVAAMLAVSGAVVLVACITLIIIGAIRNVIEERKQLKAVADEVKGWEGTD